jgi:hypothetical protein
LVLVFDAAPACAAAALKALPNAVIPTVTVADGGAVTGATVVTSITVLPSSMLLTLVLKTY